MVWSSSSMLLFLPFTLAWFVSWFKLQPAVLHAELYLQFFLNWWDCVKYTCSWHVESTSWRCLLETCLAVLRNILTSGNDTASVFRKWLMECWIADYRSFYWSYGRKKKLYTYSSFAWCRLDNLLIAWLKQEMSYSTSMSSISHKWSICCPPWMSSVSVFNAFQSLF